jgi:transposase
VDVRAYTADPVSKRQQLKAISDMIDAEVAARAEAELVKLASIPGYARSTASTVHRGDRGPFD